MEDESGLDLVGRARVLLAGNPLIDGHNEFWPIGMDDVSSYPILFAELLGRR